MKERDKDRASGKASERKGGHLREREHRREREIVSEIDRGKTER